MIYQNLLLFFPVKALFQADTACKSSLSQAVKNFYWQQDHKNSYIEFP